MRRDSTTDPCPTHHASPTTLPNHRSMYSIANPEVVFSPAIVVFHELLEANIARMVEIAGGPRRLRPHVKTHKLAEVVRLQQARGIEKFKCATIAEAEMLAECQVPDIFLAYNLVGPNIGRAVRFQERFPLSRLAVTADDAGAMEALGRAEREQGRTIDVLLDIDSGQHRTGVPLGDRAVELYRTLATTEGLTPGGLHVYDGQNHQTVVEERRRAVLAIWDDVRRTLDRLDAERLPAPRVVVAGSGSFPIWASLDDPRLELSPGTVVFHDIGYGERFPDLPFVPAALLLTRVVSRPSDRRLTLDLGYKAVAGDPPAGNRVRLVGLPDAKEVLHNEEHLVVETERAGEFQVGDVLLAIPRHICPCSALHKQVYVVRDGRVTETWQVASRDRQLTV